MMVDVRTIDLLSISSSLSSSWNRQTDDRSIRIERQLCCSTNRDCDSRTNKISPQPRYRNEKRSRKLSFTAIVFNRIREVSREDLIWSYFFAISVNDLHIAPFLTVYPIRIRYVFTIAVLERTTTCRIVYARGKMTWVQRYVHSCNTRGQFSIWY